MLFFLNVLISSHVSVSAFFYSNIPTHTYIFYFSIFSFWNWHFAFNSCKQTGFLGCHPKTSSLHMFFFSQSATSLYISFLYSLNFIPLFSGISPHWSKARICLEVLSSFRCLVVYLTMNRESQDITYKIHNIW